MIDAYTIGITLALDNGVSEGLATIRRDLIELNGVVEGSGTRLKDLTRAAAGLRIRPGAAEPSNKGSTAPVRGHSDGAISMPSVSASLDPGLFSPSRSDLLGVATTLMPMFSPPAVWPITDVGMLKASRPSMMSPEIRSLGPGLPSSTPFTSQQQSQNPAIGNFAPVQHPWQILSPMPTRTASADGSADRHSLGPGAAPPLSAITNAVSPRSQPVEPNISVSQGDGGASPHRSQQQAAGMQADLSQIALANPSNTPFWSHPPNVNSTFPSAVPPPSEAQSAPSQGDVYVDGSRLGRWVTDRLVKAAELPRAAATGFDPRMTPTWPGASVSG